MNFVLFWRDRRGGGTLDHGFLLLLKKKTIVQPVNRGQSLSKITYSTVIQNQLYKACPHFTRTLTPLLIFSFPSWGNLIKFLFYWEYVRNHTSLAIHPSSYKRKGFEVFPLSTSKSSTLLWSVVRCLDGNWYGKVYTNLLAKSKFNVAKFQLSGTPTTIQSKSFDCCHPQTLRRNTGDGFCK